MVTRTLKLFLLLAASIGMLSGCTPGTAARQSDSHPSLNARQAERLLAASPPDTDEIWIVERPPRSEPHAPRHALTPPAGEPLHGALLVKDRAGLETLLRPLRTAVHATISGDLASVDIAQRFRNTQTTTVDAVYFLRLPDRTMVTEFFMTVGSRRIRGIIREHQQASDLYRHAQQQGYTASLLQINQSGILSTSLANIRPGEDIAVDLRYVHALHRDGEYVLFTFPGQNDLHPTAQDPEPDASFALVIDIESAQPLERMRSTHDAEVRFLDHPSPRVRVTVLHPQSTLPQTFALRFPTPGQAPSPESSALLDLLTDPNNVERLALTHGIVTPGSAILAVDALSLSDHNRGEVLKAEHFSAKGVHAIEPLDQSGR